MDCIITEKTYRVLQIFLSNKCQPSIELINLLSNENLSLQYLQALANKITIDQQARLISRQSNLIILPYEHWANAVFLKHCSGHNGMHLNVENTIKSVFESYSCGKENFGFDRDFILDVINNCPSSTCRFYKGHYEQPPHQNFPPMNMEYHGMPVQFPKKDNVVNHMSRISPTRSPLLMQPPIDPTKMNRPLSQQMTQQIIQQQHNRMNQMNESLEKQRVMQQLDKKLHDTVAAVMQANNNLGLANQMNTPNMNVNMMPHPNHSKPPISMDYARRQSYDGIETYSAASYSTSNRELLHNSWINPNVQSVNFEQRDGMIAGQEKIVRAFAELMKNMARMKAFIRPSMVKPYGKQSESLQKTLMDSIQLVQTLRNFLPKPSISLTNWKNVDQPEAAIQ